MKSQLQHLREIKVLFKINEISGKLEKIQRVPYSQKFQEWCGRLTNSQLDTIRTTLQSMTNEDEIHTSSWMPGKDWTDSPWLPIYEDACGYNVEDAGKCFGIFVWEAFMIHPADWLFGRYELNDQQIAGLTYFRIYP